MTEQTCNGWIEQPHSAKRTTLVEDGDPLYLCDDCLTDYRAETPLDTSQFPIEHLQAETVAMIRNVAGALHMVEAGHDRENFRGCTHYNCEAAKAILRAMKSAELGLDK